MINLSVVPSQLTTAARTVSTLAERIDKDPALGYEVQPAQFGGEPLTSAIDALQQECQRAMAKLVTDMKATADGLRTNATSYVATDEAAADVFTSLGNTLRADER